MIIEDSFEQRSEQWFQARLGIPTASRFSDIITTKGAPSDSAEGYMLELAADKIVGDVEDRYVSFDMKRGLELEPKARTLYGFRMGGIVQEVALVYKNSQKNVSCSPDGLLNGRGLEIQCLKRKNHAKRLMKPEAPYSKFQQIQGSMWICGLSEWDFMSFCPGMPSVFVTVKRDTKFIAALETEMIKFLRDLKDVYAKLKAKVG